MTVQQSVDCDDLLKPMVSAGVSAGKVAVSLGELKKLKYSAEDLLNTMLKAEYANIASHSRTEALNAMSRYPDNSVRTAAKAVINECNALDAARIKACDSLKKIIRGLDRTIEGHTRLDYDLASAI